MKYTKTITVNDLNAILRKYFRCRDTFILGVEIGSLKNQHRPQAIEVGMGGVCSITFESSRKLK